MDACFEALVRRVVAAARAAATDAAAEQAVVAELTAGGRDYSGEVEAARGRQLAALVELGQVDAASRSVHDAGRRVTELAVDTLAVARAGVWFLADDQASLVCADMFEADGRAHSAGYVLERRQFPRYFASLAESRVIAVADAVHDPRTAEFAEIYFKPHGVAATLDAPLRRQGAPIGVLCCEHVGAPRDWRTDETSFIGSLADAVALAIEGEQRRASEEAVAAKLALIEAQQREIQRLASPVIEIWDGVLAVPVVGSLADAGQQVAMDALLQAIELRRARWVLIDLTGVDAIEPGAAANLVAMVRAARLLGAQCLLSGIGASVARTFVATGAELGVETTGSLRASLRRCLPALARG